VAAPVDDVLEEERLALRLGDAPPKLPADQRVQLRVLVDRSGHAHELTRRLQRRQVLVQVGIATRVAAGRAAGARTD